MAQNLNLNKDMKSEHLLKNIEMERQFFRMHPIWDEIDATPEELFKAINHYLDDQLTPEERSLKELEVQNQLNLKTLPPQKTNLRLFKGIRA